MVIKFMDYVTYVCTLLCGVYSASAALKRRRSILWQRMRRTPNMCGQQKPRPFTFAGTVRRCRLLTSCVVCSLHMCAIIAIPRLERVDAAALTKRMHTHRRLPLAPGFELCAGIGALLNVERAAACRPNAPGQKETEIVRTSTKPFIWHWQQPKPNTEKSETERQEEMRTVVSRGNRTVDSASHRPSRVRKAFVGGRKQHFGHIYKNERR